MRPTRLRATLIALLTATTLIASAEPASAVNVRHSGHFWTWTGPSTWHAAYGTYGIQVESPTGTDVLDLGFSSTVCTAGATYGQSVINHYRALRARYNTGAFRILAAGSIYHPTGTSTLYRRESLRVRIVSGGVTYTGAFIFDYDYQTTVSTGFSTVNYCYQRSLGFYAPASRFDTSSFRILFAIYQSLGYFGPGVPNKQEDPTL